jgi:hypothetical protein
LLLDHSHAVRKSCLCECFVLCKNLPRFLSLAFALFCVQFQEGVSPSKCFCGLWGVTAQWRCCEPAKVTTLERGGDPQLAQTPIRRLVKMLCLHLLTQTKETLLLHRSIMRNGPTLTQVTSWTKCQESGDAR